MKWHNRVLNANASLVAGSGECKYDLPEPVGKLEAHESQDDSDANEDGNQDRDLRAVEHEGAVIQHHLSRHVGTSTQHCPAAAALAVAGAENKILECGPMPNVMAALPNIDGALCSKPQSLADAYY